MRENIKLVFGAIWIPTTGCLFASGLLFVVTLGDFAEYFVWSLGIWSLATFVVWLTALD